ncbi:MAG TPA: hypothetical protein VFR32_08755 [Gaiellaceae bacterium]|nr:hypothetical protein [Gaiellaceae bacterium]
MALGGAATGLAAAPTQDVTASLACQPATVKPPASVGCTLTVQNNGNNNVNDLEITVAATGGAFVDTSDDASCTGIGTSTLTCLRNRLVAGDSYSETHEVSVPAESTIVSQRVSGRFSPNPNRRGSDSIPPVTVVTAFNGSGNFDGTYANDGGDSVSTDPATDFYSTSVGVTGAQFAAGLTVEDDVDATQGAFDNCPPTGCFHAKIVFLEIDALLGFPDTFAMTITVEVPRGTQVIELRHDGVLQALCPTEGEPTGTCYTFTIDRVTSVATIVVTGAGSDNGEWGAG